MDISFFRQHKALSTLTIIFLTLTILSFLLIAWNYSRLAPSIVLHFDSFHGVDAFGSRTSLWWIWLLGLAVCLVNVGLVYEFYNRERFLSYLFLGANVFTSFFIMVIIGVIISIN